MKNFIIIDFLQIKIILIVIIRGQIFALKIVVYQLLKSGGPIYSNFISLEKVE